MGRGVGKLSSGGGGMMIYSEMSSDHWFIGPSIFGYWKTCMVAGMGGNAAAGLY